MLRLIAFCVFAWLGTLAAAAQQWPERGVRIIVPYAAGGGTDIVARVLAQKFTDRFGQRFVVENRPGASGMVGAAAVAKAEPDGYTLLVASPAEIALAPTMFKSMTYDPIKELAPVTLLAWTPLILAAHPSFEASDPASFVRLIKEKPVDYSTPGVGSSHHLTGEYINKLHGTKLVHIPYRGAAPAVTDALSGQVKLTVSGLPPVVPHLRSKGLKAIAVTSRQRASTFPDVPALAETPGFEEVDFTNWFGLLAPAGTPRAIVDRLHEAAVEALGDPKSKEVLMAQAAEPVGNTPDQFRDFIRAEAAKYGKIVELTGVKAGN